MKSAIIIAVCLMLAAVVGCPPVATPPEVSKSMSIDNPDGALSSWSCIIGGKAYVKIVMGLSTSDVASLWTDLRYFEDVAKVKEVNVLLMSGGGDAFAGLALADEIERAKGRGVTVNAYASGIIASATVPVFAVCSKRVAAPGTVFMVHEASIFKFLSNEKASDIRAQNDLMNLLQAKYIGKLVENSKLSKDQWEAKESRTTWFSAEQAKEWGLVDEVK